ncbi:MAG TPA: hypothetical protein VHG53_04220 [Candidatus Limnocylindria bacterium]|nr:hypothetical protein [Candidatus Limnocylindria bacterium]
MGQCGRGQVALEGRDLGLERIVEPQGAVDAGPLMRRELLRREPPPAGLAEQIPLRAAQQRVDERGLDLIAQPGAPLDEGPVLGDVATADPGRRVGDPDRGDEVRGQQLGEDPGVDLVGLDLRVGDRRVRKGLDTTTVPAWALSRSAMAQVFAVAWRTTWSSRPRVAANARRAAGSVEMVYW